MIMYVYEEVENIWEYLLPFSSEYFVFPSRVEKPTD